VQYGNEWCARLDVEVQWQSTEMRRQGALMDKICTDQQRQDTEILQIGTKVDRTHRMMERMMRHMAIQDPPRCPN
jgi:hypothetical protein